MTFLSPRIQPQPLAWQTERHVWLQVGQALLLETLAPPEALLRRLIRIGSERVHDLTLSGRRIETHVRLLAPATLLIVDRRVGLTFHQPVRFARIDMDGLCRALALMDAACDQIDSVSMQESEAARGDIMRGTDRGQVRGRGSGVVAAILKNRRVTDDGGRRIRLRNVAGGLAYRSSAASDGWLTATRIFSATHEDAAQSVPAVFAVSRSRSQAAFWLGLPGGCSTATVRCIGQWLMSQGQRQDAEAAIFLARIRSRESYQLMRFLVRPDLVSVDLQALARQYGLSYSQFRKLCKRAMGHSAKNERSRWRAGRALLSVILNDQTILDAAVASGYSSASHISSDIKRVFGVAPSVFIQPHRVWQRAGQRAGMPDARHSDSSVTGSSV